MTSNLNGDHPGSTENNGNLSPRMSRAWRFVMIALLTIGIFFRFANLDHKVYWFDEVSTSIRVAGQTKHEVEQQFIRQGSVSAHRLIDYQTLQPNTSWQETFDALKQSPEQAPLYYLLARLWTQVFGSSVLAIRTLSAFISLLALPCIYLLGLELFRDQRPGWILVMLLSVSPFFVAYAQEARPYSLWTAVILLSSVTCLRAKRLNTRRSWGVFAIATTLSFYTSLLSLFVTIGQGLYLATQERFRLLRTQYLAQYLAAVGVAIVCFSPWLVIILTSVKTFQDNTGWMRTPMELPAMVAIWFASILLTFGDFPIPTSIDPVKTLGVVLLPLLLMLGLFLVAKPQVKTKQQMTLFMMVLTALGTGLLFGGLKLISSGSQFLALNPLVAIGLVVAPFIFTLVIYALRFIRSSTSLRIWSFPLTLGLTTPLALMLIDLLQRGQSSANPRYMVPVQLAIQLAVAGLLSHNIFNPPPKSIGSSQRWTGVMAFVIGVGLISCTLNLEKSPIYQKSRNLHNQPIAEILNPIESPLILAEPQATLDLISLSHSLEPDTQVSPFTKDALLTSSLCPIQPLFIFNPTPRLQAQLQSESDFKASPVYQPKPLIPSEITLSLWSIKPVNSCRPQPISQP